jgi:hypothetical protein
MGILLSAWRGTAIASIRNLGVDNRAITPPMFSLLSHQHYVIPELLVFRGL